MLEEFVVSVQLQLQCEAWLTRATSWVSTAGFSPQQWALGAGHRLSASLASPDNDPAVVSG
eukprot:3199437-Pyramimonas_sp.AAC.2